MKNCYIVDLKRGLTCICCLQSTWTFLWHQIHWKSLSPGPSPAGSSHTSQIESRGRFPSTHLNRKEIYITAHITDVCKRWGGGSSEIVKSFFQMNEFFLSHNNQKRKTLPMFPFSFHLRGCLFYSSSSRYRFTRSSSIHCSDTFSSCTCCRTTNSTALTSTKQISKYLCKIDWKSRV